MKNSLEDERNEVAGRCRPIVAPTAKMRKSRLILPKSTLFTAKQNQIVVTTITYHISTEFGQ